MNVQGRGRGTGPGSVTGPGNRTIVLRFMDWQVYVAACARGWDLLAPAAVVEDHRIIAANGAARRSGVVTGMKARHALGICPSLNIGDVDRSAEGAAHEEVLAGLEQVTASVETLRPGLVAVSARSLTRYYGSESRAVELLVDAAARAGADCLAGVADELVTAVWAAAAGVNVPQRGSASWLAGLPLGVLVSEPVLGAPVAMVETLSGLGIRTLADFAALPRRDVVGRFGAVAAAWHRAAAGEPERTVSPVHVSGPPRVTVEPEEPVCSTETAAFLARRAAAGLHSSLADTGTACLRLAVTAVLAPPPGWTGPHTVERLWRCREPLTEEDTAQRVRWQLEGWLTRGLSRGLSRGRTRAGEIPGILSAGDDGAEEGGEGLYGVRAVTLTPVECVPAGSIAEPLWGGTDDGLRSARAAAARAQALIGTRAVLRPVLRGGHGVVGRVVTVPYGEEDPEEIRSLPTRRWEGELPAPLPGLVAETPVRLLGVDGRDIVVTGRGAVSSPPAVLRVRDRDCAVTGWAGPWPVDERWWNPQEADRCARLQVATDEPAAHLLRCRGSEWIIEASY